MTASTITRPRRWLRRPDTGGTGGGRDGNALIGQSKATPYLFSLPAIILVAAILGFPVIYGTWQSLYRAPSLAEDESFRDRFLHESELAASIDHPNIVPIYEAGTTEELLYIAMRYVEGRDLKERLQRGRLEPRDAIGIVAQVASALDAAHGRGLVHRDVKPSNVLLDTGARPDGSDHVYLADFGITRRISEEPGIREVSNLMGTPDYVAPEQIVGGDIDGRADVYSLGCMLYELLAGRKPYRLSGQSASQVERTLERRVPGRPSLVGTSPRDGDGPDTVELAFRRGTSPDRLRRRLSGDLDNIALKALSREPERRYGSAERLAEDVRMHLEGRPVSARAPTFGYLFGKFARRHWPSVLSGVLMLLSMAAGFGAARWQAGQTATAEAVAERRADEAITSAEALFEAGDPVAAMELLTNHPGDLPRVAAALARLQQRHRTTSEREVDARRAEHDRRAAEAIASAQARIDAGEHREALEELEQFAPSHPDVERVVRVSKGVGLG